MLETVAEFLYLPKHLRKCKQITYALYDDHYHRHLFPPCHPSLETKVQKHSQLFGQMKSCSKQGFPALHSSSASGYQI
jgi:hypothetical protein